MDETAIWERFKSGSEKDFSFLYQHFAPMMLRFGNRVCPDRELVRDSLQQVFLRMWHSRESLATPSNVRSYLLKSIRNEIIKKGNGAKQHQPLPEEYRFESEQSHEQVLIQLQAAELTKQRIADLLARLPERQREVIFLKYYANLKYDEIAAIMDIEQESVYKINYKAIARLQQLLNQTLLSLLPLFFW